MRGRGAKNEESLPECQRRGARGKRSVRCNTGTIDRVQNDVEGAEVRGPSVGRGDFWKFSSIFMAFQGHASLTDIKQMVYFVF